MKKNTFRFMGFLFVLMIFFVLSSFGCEGRKNVSLAASETPLLEKALSFNVTQVLNNNDIDIIANPDTEIQYGDDFYVTLSWSFDNDTTLSFEDYLTYQLPKEIQFEDVENGEITSSIGVVGSYSVIQNKITINYTNEEFLGGDSKYGEMTLAGKIVSGEGGAMPAEVKKIYFTDEVNVSFNMVPPSTVADMEIHNRGYKTNTSLQDHIYKYLVSFTSRGDNNNIKLNIGMYPGMELYSAPEFYYDKKCTDSIEETRYSIDDATLGGRAIDVSIPSMADGETFYVLYYAYIIPEMYEWDTADQYIEDNNLKHDYYPNLYKGRVPNRAAISSDETKAGDANGITNSGRKDGLRTSWADIITMRGSFNKWANPTMNRDGYLHWEIAIYSIYDADSDTNYENGCIIDTLPENTSFVPESLEVKNNVTGEKVENYVSYKISDDKTQVVFNFSEEMMDYLKSDANSQILLRYYTKINEQNKKGVTYYNNAEIRYDGANSQSTRPDLYYTKPDELTKTSKYTAATAPNVEYTIKVNPAALDLDPNGDTLTLEDEMSSSYDLVPGSVVVQKMELDEKTGNIIYTPTDIQCDYNSTARKMTFSLADSTAYLITYKAAVNLIPDSQLDESNSGNSVKLYSENIEPFGTENKFKCRVYKSAANSGSEQILYTLNVIKHDADSENQVLSDAKFSLTQLKKNDDGSYSIDENATKSEKTTDENGLASFGSLKKGVIYMLVEDEAPQNYDKNEEPSFYAFSTSTLSNVTEITYDGKTYKLNLIDSSKVSLDLYYADNKTPTIQGSSNQNDPNQGENNQNDPNQSGSTDKDPDQNKTTENDQNQSGSTEKNPELNETTQENTNGNGTQVDGTTSNDKQQSSDAKNPDPSKMEDNNVKTPSNNTDNNTSNNTPATPADNTSKDNSGASTPAASTPSASASTEKDNTGVNTPVSPKPTTGQNSSQAVKTGDGTNMILAEIILLISLFAIIAIILKKIIK